MFVFVHFPEVAASILLISAAFFVFISLKGVLFVGYYTFYSVKEALKELWILGIYIQTM